MSKESSDIAKTIKPDGPNSFGHQWFKENRGKQIKITMSNGNSFGGRLVRWDKYKFGIESDGKIVLINQSQIGYLTPLEDDKESDDE